MQRETILRQIASCFTVCEEKENSTFKALFPLQIQGQNYYIVLICAFKYYVCWECERWNGGTKGATSSLISGRITKAMTNPP